MPKQLFLQYPVQRIELFAPDPNIRYLSVFEFEIELILSQYEAIQYKTTQLNG